MNLVKMGFNLTLCSFILMKYTLLSFIIVKLPSPVSTTLDLEIIYSSFGEITVIPSLVMDLQLKQVKMVTLNVRLDLPADLYYGGEAFSVEQPQAFTCPYCGRMGYTEISLQEHVAAEHTETSTEVVSLALKCHTQSPMKP